MAACPDPTCPGVVDDTGYCDLCGRRATPDDGEQSTTPPPEPAGSIPADSVPAGSVPTALGAHTGRPDPGSGIVSLPFLPIPDPSSRVLKQPRPPSSGRICGKGDCQGIIGVGYDGRPLVEGFCPQCGTPFSYRPKLAEGELVGGQYEVKGCLAHGGLGWVYLAWDRNLRDHVALKGLINANDEEARKLTHAERTALTSLDHPNIVGIRNFVPHPDPQGEPVDYIVMEYVGGRSLQEIKDEARRKGDPFHPEPFRAEHVAGYGLEILSAFGYLHGLGLLYCDLKPANVIHCGDRIKLIDLGAVRRIEDRSSPIIGTPGYQVPDREIATRGLTVQSDLYTVGRTLQELLDATQDAPGHGPVGPGIESLRRLLRRATDRDPDRRFTSAEEMAEQLRGVLREIRSLRDGQERPEPSAWFVPSPVLLDGGLGSVPALRWWTDPGDTPRERTAQLLADMLPTAPQIARGLPEPRVDPGDPAAGFLGAVAAGDPGMLLDKLTEFEGDSAAVELARCRAFLALDDVECAATHLGRAVRAPGRTAWSLEWHHGLLALARGDVRAARDRFDLVYTALPGESVPKLALGLCAEHLGDLESAERHHEAVWRLDRSQVNAAFGLARIHLTRARRKEALGVLDEVPKVSRHHDAAQVAAIRVLLGRLPGTGNLPTAEEFQQVLRRLPDLYLDGGERDGDTRSRLVAVVREVALERLADLHGKSGGATLGEPVTERRLRELLEGSIRRIARQARSRDEHDAVIDYANSIRPTTLR